MGKKGMLLPLGDLPVPGGERDGKGSGLGNDPEHRNES